MSVPLSDAQLAAITAGREAVRAKLAGGAFPAALGRAVADELADAAMAPLLADAHEAVPELVAEVDRLRALVERPEDVRYRDRHGDVWVDRPGGDVQLVRTVAMVADCDNGWREQRESVERDFGPLVPVAALPDAEDGAR
jgi:hypothetical protein